MTAVRLQLQWEPQAQFAGYFAADAEGYYEEEGLEVEILRGGPDIIPQDRRLGPERSRVHDLVGAQGARRCAPARLSRTWSTSPRSSSARAPDPSHGRPAPGRSRQRRGHHLARAVRAARTSAPGASETSTRSRQRRCSTNWSGQRGLHASSSSLQHGAAAQSRDRRRRGDDLQRVRPGARSREPRDRRALPARRPERDRLQRGRHGDAPGRALRSRRVARRGGQRGHRRALPARVVPRLDLLPRQPRRHASRTPSSRVDACRRPPGVDDERDQPADLAVARRHRHDADADSGSRRSRSRSRPGSFPRHPAEDAYRTDLAEAALEGIEDDATGADFEKGTVEVTPGGE